MVSLAYDNGMVHASGAGIPAPSNAIDVCFGKHQSALKLESRHQATPLMFALANINQR